MAGSIDLTALNSNLGAYCRENKDQIFADMLLGLEDALSKTGITVLDNIKDELVLPNVMVGDLVRPGDYENFNAGSNKIKFNNRKLKVRPFKADLLIYPQQFEASWLTHIRKSKGTYTADNFPFYEFLMNKIVQKIQRELRFAVFQGVYNGSGSGWADICDGLLKKIADDVIAGNIIEVNTGVVTASNVLQCIEDTVRAMGVDYKDQPGKCIVSPTLFEWYISISEDKAGRSVGFNELSGGTNAPGQKGIFVRGTNIELVQEPAMGSSQRIIATTADNLFVGTDTVDEFNSIRAQEFERSIKLMIDGKIGTDYALANNTYKPISVNDQA